MKEKENIINTHIVVLSYTGCMQSFDYNTKFLFHIRRVLKNRPS
jgi:hypothetical protein